MSWLWGSRGKSQRPAYAPTAPALTPQERAAVQAAWERGRAASRAAQDLELKRLYDPLWNNARKTQRNPKTERMWPAEIAELRAARDRRVAAYEQYRKARPSQARRRV